MKTLIAFIKKEWLELIRTGKLILLIIISILFGIMNPLIAKITPWMMEMLSSDLADAGMIVSNFKVDVMTSWTQFYKNVPLLLIIFVIIMSSILTIEYQKGTLINILTKGLQRWKVIIAKTITMIGLWTMCYWLCFLVTYLYNIYFWSVHNVADVLWGASCIYILGILCISFIMFASSIFQDNYAVLGVTGGMFILSYALSMIPTISKYLPTQLFNSMSILTGTMQIDQFIGSILITIVLSFIAIILSILFFNKKAI